MNDIEFGSSGLPIKPIPASEVRANTRIRIGNLKSWRDHEINTSKYAGPVIIVHKEKSDDTTS